MSIIGGIIPLLVLLAAWWIFGKVYDYTMTDDKKKD